MDTKPTRTYEEPSKVGKIENGTSSPGDEKVAQYLEADKVCYEPTGMGSMFKVRHWRSEKLVAIFLDRDKCEEYCDIRNEPIRHAASILREELMKRESLWDGFIASIVSALTQYSAPFMPDMELATRILERVVGNEDEPGTDIASFDDSAWDRVKKLEKEISGLKDQLAKANAELDNKESHITKLRQNLANVTHKVVVAENAAEDLHREECSQCGEIKRLQELLYESHNENNERRETARLLRQTLSGLIRVYAKDDEMEQEET